jgi:histidyl-tRNA synthetase
LGVLSVAIDKLEKIGKEGVKNELIAKGFSEEACQKLFDFIEINGTNEEVLEQLTKKLTASEVGKKGIEELTFILAHTKNTDIKIDISLARGLSYYTGCIFEVTSTSGSLKSSIGGGGRYDNLTGIFGMPGISGVGISFGLDRIYDVMEELQLFPQNQHTSTSVLICALDQAALLFAIDILAKLRAASISSELYPDIKKLGKQLDYANALNIPFAIIIGSTEQETGKLTFKNLTAGTQLELTVEEIIHQLNSL